MQVDLTRRLALLYYENRISGQVGVLIIFDDGGIFPKTFFPLLPRAIRDSSGSVSIARDPSRV